MSKPEAGKQRIFNKEFAKLGVAGVIVWDIFPVSNGELVFVVFEEANSPWRQGIWLKTDRGIEVDNELCPSVLLWFDTAPREVQCRCFSNDGCLSVYNVWDRGLGKNSLSWSSGMLVEEVGNGRRYRCNDIGFDTRFDKLILRVERRPTLN
jgi:hypothetical protein